MLDAEGVFYCGGKIVYCFDEGFNKGFKPLVEIIADTLPRIDPSVEPPFALDVDALVNSLVVACGRVWR